MSKASDSDFDAWCLRRRPKLLRTANAILKDHDEAENIVQATLLAVWEASRSGEAKDKDAYAQRAVWLNAVRYRVRRREFAPLEALEALEFEEPLAAPPELVPWELEAAILDLPHEQQAALRLRYYGGLSFKEIGRALHISLNTAASRCRYAVAALKVAYGFNNKQHDKE